MYELFRLNRVVRSPGRFVVGPRKRVEHDAPQKDLDDEELLQSLIRQVDAKLLKGIRRQVLEAVDVQHTNAPAARG